MQMALAEAGRHFSAGGENARHGKLRGSSGRGHVSPKSWARSREVPTVFRRHLLLVTGPGAGHTAILPGH